MPPLEMIKWIFICSRRQQKNYYVGYFVSLMDRGIGVLVVIRVCYLITHAYNHKARRLRKSCKVDESKYQSKVDMYSKKASNLRVRMCIINLISGYRCHLLKVGC